MKSLLATPLILVLLLTTAYASTTTNEETIVTITNKDKAVALLNSIQTGDQSAVGYVNAEKYKQHNLSVGDGLTGFGAVLQALPKDSARVNVVHAFSDGDFVFTHTDYNFFGPKIGFDVFRFEDGLIVEHWDNLAEKAQSPNPSSHTQIDGPTAIHNLDKTEQNKELVTDFVDSILVNGQMDKLPQFIEGDNYTQHNTAIADGLSGLGAALEAMAAQGIKMVYSDVHKVLGEGNFVLAVSEGSFAGQPISFYDLFRIDNSKIVEHWDVIETIIPESQWKNNNGKFGGLN